MMTYRYNVVLSGGGVRGYAHIGALEALYEKGLDINAISATSAGAMVGVFICDGFHPTEVKELILKEAPKISFNLAGFKQSFLSIDAIKKFITRHLRSSRFEQLKLPFYVTATNLNTGEPKVFNEGPILDVLLAASAIPTLFAPIIIENIPYADGGISDNLPTGPFLKQTPKLLGIHVNPIGDYQANASLVHNIDRSVHMAMLNGIRDNIRHCNTFIEPPGLAAFHLFENKKTAEIIKTGYDYVKNHVQLNP